MVRSLQPAHGPNLPLDRPIEIGGYAQYDSLCEDNPAGDHDCGLSADGFLASHKGLSSTRYSLAAPEAALRLIGKEF
jgi:hypothetical protein